MGVAAVQDLYKNYPSQLKGWKSDGGDPCEEPWKVISCSGCSIIYIQLSGLDIGGYLGGQLGNLLSLKQLDVSSNHIQGGIPYFLPPNVTQLDFSCNNFTVNIPDSLSFMKHLRHLNISRNSLSGPIGNIFTGLQNLKRMDLSYNSFTGDLPSSFQNLTNLTGLYLQNNEFTGSVIFLANLRLIDLSRRRQEQSLVKWGSSRLHDYKCLEAIVDPTTRPMFSSRSLSRFADIVSLCIQTEPEFRPTMSEIVESLELLNDGIEVESF